MQCTEKSVPYGDGQQYLPDIVYFITPFEIDSKSLQSGLEPYVRLRAKGVKIIDGPRLISLVENKLPYLLDDILSPVDRLSKATSQSLNNETLLKALELQSVRHVNSYFTDIDFSFGSVPAYTLFSKLDPIYDCKSINISEWPKLSEIAHYVYRELRCHIIPSLTDLENVYNNKLADYNEWNASHSKVENSYYECLDKIKSTNKKIKESNKTLVNIPDLDKILLESTLSEKILKEAYDKSLKRKPDSNISVSLDGVAVKESLDVRRRILSTLNRFNENPNSDSLKCLLAEACSSFDIVNHLLEVPLLSVAIGLKSPSSRVITAEQTRVKASLFSVFNTGINVTVLGVAGAGKTTALQMYAHHLLNERKVEKPVLFIPLTRIYNILKRENYEFIDDISSPSFTPQKELEKLLISYIISLNIDINVHSMQHIFDNIGGVLLLDGIDEVFLGMPWLIDAIRALSEKYNKVQFILSSRMSGNYVRNLPFLNIVILPFTSEQREQFVINWFGESNIELCDKVLKHLNHNQEIAEICSLPLLATILCVLCRI